MPHPLENCRLSANLDEDGLVVIVRFRGDAEYWGQFPPPANPNVMHQVTLYQEKISRCKRFIRLGETLGDELIGWQRRDSLEVVCVLGKKRQDSLEVEAA